MNENINNKLLQQQRGKKGIGEENNITTANTATQQCRYIIVI